MSDFSKRCIAPGQASSEAAGLRWLREGSEAVVEVRSVDEGQRTLRIERVETVRPTRDAARRAGEELAKIHAMGAEAFGAPPTGWDGPNFIGRVEQDCVPEQRWAKFYTEQRVLPFARAAHVAGNISKQQLELVERACAALVEEDEEAPLARIHGDLWAGNLLFDESGPRFIDPAAHSGHPLTDIAMLALFGAPFLEDIVEGYESRASLGSGWRRRIPIHQLHPLAVHALTHGPAYAGELANAAQATLDLTA